VRDRGFPIRNEEGKVYRIAGIAEDFTARREAEMEICRLNDELEQRVVERTAELEAANRELEGFAYSVAHDLRAPLRGINGFLNILLEDLGEELDEEAQGYLRSACKSTIRMDRLINDLLTFSQLSRQPLERRPVRPTALVHEALRDLSHLAKDREIDLTVDDLAPCRADATLLKQVFANLLGNALKFTREGVVPRIHVGCDIADGEPIFFVRDNGIGFDMRHADKLFGVFQRLHRSDEYEGTGVGLALTQRIVERHGGRLWAQAEEGRGATFYFSVGSSPGNWRSTTVRSQNRSRRRSRVDESVTGPAEDASPREEA
jgi:light-regulated signal transduction histidine kinase (bacteriophytochrome)